MEDGVAGYAYYPSSVEGTGFWRDGIIILHNYIADIGTGNPNRSRALTHEIGHWLGLAHPWGSTNDPGELSNCLIDDGIEDTPNTVGWTTCNLQGTTCDEELDNVQNFMEYSYCSNMFTIGQSDFMRAILNSTLSGRNALWDEDNLALTLGDLNELASCEPVADFHTTIKSVCLDTPVQFTNHSWRTQGNVSYQWEFPTGNPATSSSQNPSVSWDTPGWKSVQLTVIDNQGSHTKSEEQYIFVSPDWRDYVGPVQLTFDENPASFIVDNPTKNEAKWEIQNGVGIGGSKAIILRNTSPYSNFLPFTNEAFYNNRLAGNIDEFTTPSFDLSNTSNISVSFRYAAATNASNLEEIEESLRVFVSTNCGRTWSLRQTLTGMELINNGSGHLNFIPNNQTVWGQASFTLLPSQVTDNVRIKFQYIASDFSNNMVIDNININGVLGLENENPLAQILVYPNPMSSQDALYFEVPPGLDVEQVQLVDNLGKIIANIPRSAIQEQKVLLNDYCNFKSGVYYLQVSNKTHSHVVKLVVY
jgi:PKD repeat protein